MSSDPLELAQINNATKFTIFPVDKEVIIPVNCSCSGRYYQANTMFEITSSTQTYLMVANNTYQGLSTCDSLKSANPHGEFDLQAGLHLHIPLRCACPTEKQSANGTNYLLTYSIFWDDNIFGIGTRFNASAKTILDANEFSEEDPTLFPFTTILVPLSSQPSSSQTKVHKYKPIISSPPASSILKNKSKRNLYIGLGVAAGSSLLLFIIILFVFVRFYKKRTKGIFKSNGGGKSKGALQEDLLVEIASFDQSLKVFSFDELKKATENFGLKSKIRGSVYQGAFSGEVLAVKKMSIDVSREVKMLNKINHFNLINLQGVCKHDGCFYLVYEYMKNGSLREWLCKKKPEGTDGWIRRIQIALDVANGLQYLHNFTKPACVHKDIKSSNILLDANLRAKIANFSLASTAITEGTDTKALTRIVGTRGYMAPEYIETGSLTPKTDVYAFGVVMLELITGKEAVIIQEGRGVLLTAVIASIMEGENAQTELRYFIDPGLGENKEIEYAVRVVKLSLMCLKRDATSRPSMSDVASTLVKIQIDLENSDRACLKEEKIAFTDGISEKIALTAIRNSM